MKVSQLCALPLAFAFSFAASHAEENHVKVEVRDEHAKVEVRGEHAKVEVRDEHAKVAVADHHGKKDFRMKVSRKGDHYVGFYNNREYVLRGDAASHITVDGEYTIYGDIGADDTYIETSEFVPVVVETRPVIVERRPEVVHEREVIVERRPEVVHEREVIVERRDEPLIKVGPVRIGN